MRGKALVRFVGDPTGYIFDLDLEAPFPLDWVTATIGHMDETVEVDPSKAYVRERFALPDEERPP